MAIDFSQFLPKHPNYEFVEVSSKGFFFDVLSLETPPLVKAISAQPEEACLIQDKPAVIISRVPMTRRKRGIGMIEDHKVEFLSYRTNEDKQVFYKHTCWASDL